LCQDLNFPAIIFVISLEALLSDIIN
jgi:hypothetical protein